MSFIRTALGDIDPSMLGVCDAHEHVIIDSPFINATFPDFALDDVDKACVDVSEFVAAGGGAMVDTMPIGCGRSAVKLAEVSRRAQCHIVIPTGIHLSQYYPPNHWTIVSGREQLVQWFCDDVEIGIATDESGPPTTRTDIRAGVIKVAGSVPMTDFEQTCFAAAAETQQRMGCPIITHTEGGREAIEQVRLLERGGADLSRVTLSHVDRIIDAGPHRELLASGINLEYDGHFRTKNEVDNPTVNLIASLIDEFPGQIMVGMDAARRSYWHAYGGQPGLSWLVTRLRSMLTDAGVTESQLEMIYLKNPAKAFSFCYGD